ncbi:MAG: hypothetical protein KIS87_10405 [Phycisphaeraceae bacterium]|nr:hypothetical protein [Phycisphaeraceae bacterium]
MSYLRIVTAWLTAGLLLVTGASAQPATKTIALPMRTDGPKSLDPAVGSTTYDNMATVQFYETLLQVCYYDESRFEPLLLAEMPVRLDDGRRFRFRLKEGVRFHDDPCFPGGRGRTVTADDVFYSWKRLTDKRNGLKNWWLLEDTIVGLDAFKEAQNAALDAGGSFDYDAPVEGFVRVSDLEFEVVLTKPVFRFLWVLTMFQSSVVPREAVERYGQDFASRPVGTGPFVLREWVPKQKLIAERNPNYHACTYPEASLWSEADRAAGLAEAAGQRLPIADRIEFTMYVPDQPVWLEFQQGTLGYIELPFDYFSQAFNPRTKRMNADLRRRGVGYRAVPQLDMIFRAFNMDDPVVGGYTEDRKKLRRAISLAMDLQEFNDAFYSGLCVVYDGPIPPGLDGHPDGGRVSGAPRGPDLELARRYLAEAGYPDGRGLPTIRFYTSQGGNNADQVELLRRQLGRIGVRIDVQLVDFSTLIELVNKRSAPMFSFAWLTDYPDGENNLALFYGPNESPGSNHWNYKNPAFDALYEQAVVLGPGPERTALYERMRDIVIDDCPMIGSLARTRYYLTQPWMKNARPTERFWSWFKYLDVDDSKR